MLDFHGRRSRRCHRPQLFPNTDDDGLAQLAATDVAGIAGVAQANWNNVMVTHNSNGWVEANFSGAVDNSGAATGLSVTVDQQDGGGAYIRMAGGGDWGFTGTDKILREGSVRRDIEVNVSDIPYALYDVYIYHYFWQAQNQDVSLAVADGATGSVDPDTYYFRLGGNATYTQATDTAMPAEGNPAYANYVLFSGNTASSFDVVSDRLGVGVAAIQIVAVPEPASLALLGLGSAVILLRRRRLA